MLITLRAKRVNQTLIESAEIPDLGVIAFNNLEPYYLKLL